VWAAHVRALVLGRTGCEWIDTRKGKIKHALGLTDIPHTHHAGQDAAELAHVFDAARRYPAEPR
jgi:hypothetical protein